MSDCEGLTYRFFHTYPPNSFAEENAFGARYSQPWAWAYYNSQHPDPNATTLAAGYRPERAPTFEEARSALPSPFWAGHDLEIAAYWKVWSLMFPKNIRRATARNRFVSHFAATAFNDDVYLWDSAFISLFGRYARRVWNVQATLDNFYCKQHPDGFICREIGEEDGEDRFQRFDPAGTGPNVLAWAEWEYYRHTGDRARLARVFAPIAGYTRWMRANCTWPDGSYWATGWSCGMDNQPRLPPGCPEWYQHGHQTWVDACMQAVLADRMLVAIAREIGRGADAVEFDEEARFLADWVNQHLWSDRTGFYHDRRRDGSLSLQVKTVGAYWALLAGLVPPNRLERFLAHLEDPRAFARAHRCPSLSADSPGYDPTGGYWRGGVWAPTNYMLLRGLVATGHSRLAFDIALNHLGNVAQVFAETGTLWENYAPEFAGKGSPSKGDFVGWTGLAPVAVLFEYIFGLQPDATAKRLVWEVQLTEEFGVERYPFGQDGVLALRCAARSNPAEKPRISVESAQPLEIELRWPGGREVIAVAGDGR